MGWGRGGPQGATSGSTTGGGHRGSRATGIFQPVAEAGDQAAAQLQEPPNANTAIDALDSAGDALEALGEAFDRIGAQIIDAVYFDPRVAHYFEELGKYVKAAAEPTREGVAQIRQVHAERLQQIEENDPRIRKWDLQAHDD